MSENDLERIFQRGPNCPSEPILDRYHFGELTESELRIVEQHLPQCTACRERVALRERDFAAFPKLDVEAMVSALHQRLAGRPEPAWIDKYSPTKTTERSGEPVRSPFRRLRWFALAAVPVAVILLIALAVGIGREPDDGIDGETIRVMGGPKLQVYRERGGVVEQAMSGEVFRCGDRLRFEVDVPWPGQVIVFGVEESGGKYGCYPTGEGKESRPIAAATRQLLPGAVQLDDSVGDEWICLVVCPEPFSLDQVGIPDRSGSVSTPRGCITDCLRMTKISQ